MFAYDPTLEEAVQFSRFDKESPFSTIADYGFELDGHYWRTAEHYYQACKFKGMNYENIIREAEDGELAYQLGNRWLKRKVKGWKSNRQVYMTRALYRRVMEFSAVKEALLETGDEKIIETSQYDYFWGLGRDQRGKNTLGQIWMDIRKKIQE